MHPGDAAERSWTIDAARRMWVLYEPVHALTYFAPARISDARAGIVPGVTPTAALAVRLAGIDAAFADLPDRPDAADLAEAADLAWEAAQACDDAGRVLGAANRALPRPAAAHLALWAATTTLREHRGDGHLAALAVHGVGPVAAHVLKVAAGESPGRDLRLGRRIPDGAWSATLARLTGQGLVTGPDDEPELTLDGAALHAAVEGATDHAAAGPWEALGPARTDRLAELLAPVTAAANTVVPSRNPIGLAPR